jgi:hypothetical protein
MDALRAGPLDVQSMFRVDPEKVKSFAAYQDVFKL